jgi:hypothetical protein
MSGFRHVRIHARAGSVQCSTVTQGDLKTLRGLPAGLGAKVSDIVSLVGSLLGGLL